MSRTSGGKINALPLSTYSCPRALAQGRKHWHFTPPNRKTEHGPVQNPRNTSPEIMANQKKSSDGRGVNLPGAGSPGVAHFVTGTLCLAVSGVQHPEWPQVLPAATAARSDFAHSTATHPGLTCGYLRNSMARLRRKSAEWRCLQGGHQGLSASGHLCGQRSLSLIGLQVVVIRKQRPEHLDTSLRRLCHRVAMQKRQISMQTSQWKANDNSRRQAAVSSKETCRNLMPTED